MLVRRPRLRDEVELVDEQDARAQLLGQLEHLVDVLRGLAEVLGRDHRQLDFEERQAEPRAHRPCRGGLAGPRGADEQQLPDLPKADLPQVVAILYGLEYLVDLGLLLGGKDDLVDLLADA
jgi:hypothetical protein